MVVVKEAELTRCAEHRVKQSDISQSPGRVSDLTALEEAPSLRRL